MPKHPLLEEMDEGYRRVVGRFDTEAARRIAGAVAIGVKHGNNRGTYVGRMKRPRRVRADAVALYGSRQEREVYGNISRNHVAAVGTSPYDHYEVGKVVGMALLRDVLWRHYRFEVQDPNYVEYFGPTHPVVATDVYLKINAAAIGFLQRAVDAVGEVTYTESVRCKFGKVTDLANDVVACLADFGTWFSNKVFNSASFGGFVSTTGGTVELYGYNIYEYDITSATAVVEKLMVGSPFSLREQKVTVFGRIKLAVQNATTADGATGDPNNTERVDRNPVKGKLMRFRGPYPMTRAFVTDDSAGYVPILFDRNGDGLIVPSMTTGNLGGNQLFTQLPDATLFDNCTGVSAVGLEPGAIKDFSSSFRVVDTIPRLIGRMRYHDTISSNKALPRPFDYYPIGSSYILFMEKRMSTGSNTVSLNYQGDSSVSAIMGKRYRLPCTSLVITPVNYGTATEPVI